MANETIELAKNYDPKNVAKHLPAYAQIKYDGVPIRFIRTESGVVPVTRQGEVLVSVPHLCLQAEKMINSIGGSITAEVFLPEAPFKESSGAVRKQKPNLALIGMIFDADIDNRPKDTYTLRMEELRQAHSDCTRQDAAGPLIPVRDLYFCQTADDVEDAWLFLQRHYKGGVLEGMMLHHTLKPFQPGKRCWGLGRYKPQPTIDLPVIGFEEAQSEAGEPLGMVGRVNVRLSRVWLHGAPEGWQHVRGTADTYSKIVGVGPGKLTHNERTLLWQTQFVVGVDNVLRLGDKPVYAEIKYMPDPAYEALRQPTIQRLRTDKSESDVLNY